jgi:large subunit ribosomal protein L22
MEAEARARHIGYPPRKVRQVADLIRGKNVEEALEILKFTERVAAEPMSKTVKSAMHNMVNKRGGTVEAADMVIKTVLVDDGRTMYRIRPRAQGRAYRIRKRSSHITVVVTLAEKSKTKETEKLRGKEKAEAKAKAKTETKADAKMKAEAKTKAGGKTKARAKSKTKDKE